MGLPVVPVEGTLFTGGLRSRGPPSPATLPVGSLGPETWVSIRSSLGLTRWTLSNTSEG